MIQLNRMPRVFFLLTYRLMGLGNIIPAALVPRSQYLEFKKRQIDEATAVKTLDDGIEPLCIWFTFARYRCPL